MLIQNSAQPIRHRRRRNANRPWRQRHRTGGSLRDRHLLRRRLQQSFCQAILSVLSRSLLLRQPQAHLHRDAIQQLADRTWLSRRRRQRRKLRRRSRWQPQLNLRHISLVPHIRQRHHPHQRATCQLRQGPCRLPQPDPIREPHDPERHHHWWEPGLRDPRLHRREWVGPGDGTRDPELHKDAACFHGSAVKSRALEVAVGGKGGS